MIDLVGGTDYGSVAPTRQSRHPLMDGGSITKPLVAEQKPLGLGVDASITSEDVSALSTMHMQLLGLKKTGSQMNASEKTVRSKKARWIYDRSASSPFIRKAVQRPPLSNSLMMVARATRRPQKINSNLSIFPPKLIVESTNMCNAACVMCPYPHMTRRKGVMSFELFQDIVDEFSTSPKTTRLQMNNIGEPFLDRSLLKKIQYAKEQGIDSVFCFNNGSQLDEKTSKELIDSGLDRMIISLDGTDKASYEKVRKNLVFDEVLNNIKNLAELKAEKGAQNPRVELHITVSNVNKSEERHFARKMEKLADSVSIAYAHDWAGQLKPDKNGGQGGKRIQGAPCANLWSELTILWDGSVALCCLDYEGKILLGDVNDSSIKTIWNGDKLKSIRALHLKREFTSPLCQRCTERTWAHWWLNYWD